MYDQCLLLTKHPLVHEEIQQVPFGPNWLFNDWYTLYLYPTENGSLSGMVNVIHASTGPFACQQYTIVYSSFHDPKWAEPKSSWDVYPENAWKFVQDGELDFTLVITDSTAGSIHSLVHNQQSTSFGGRTKVNDIAWTLSAAPNPNIRGFNAVRNLPVSGWFNHRLSMISMVPSAHVTGRVIIDEQIHNIDCMGEVEHVWGKFVLGLLTWTMIHAHDSKHNALFYCVHMPLKDNQQAAALCVMDGNQQSITKWYSHEFSFRPQFNGLVLEGTNQDGFVVSASIKTRGPSMTEALTPSEKRVVCEVSIHHEDLNVHNTYVAHGIMEENQGGWSKVFKNLTDTMESSHQPVQPLINAQDTSKEEARPLLNSE